MQLKLISEYHASVGQLCGSAFNPGNPDDLSRALTRLNQIVPDIQALLSKMPTIRPQVDQGLDQICARLIEIEDSFLNLLPAGKWCVKREANYNLTVKKQASSKRILYSLTGLSDILKFLTKEISEDSTTRLKLLDLIKQAETLEISLIELEFSLLAGEAPVI